MLSSQTIPWESKYKIGIKIIDIQHRKLFDIVNKFLELEDEKCTKEDVRMTLHELNDYTKIHFKEEEEYMASINFGYLKLHKKLHNDIIDSFAEVLRTTAKLGVLKSKIRLIAKRIFVHHVVTEDSKMKLFKVKEEKK